MSSTGQPTPGASQPLVDAVCVVSCPSALGQLREACAALPPRPLSMSLPRAGGGGPGAAAAAAAAVQGLSRRKSERMEVGGVGEHRHRHRHQGRDPAEVALRPLVAAAWPPAAAQSIEHAAPFAFPAGMHVVRAARAPQPTVFHALRTILDGPRSYLTFLVVWERTTPEDDRSITLLSASLDPDDGSASWYIPKAVGISTTVPAYSWSREVLKHFYKNVVNGAELAEHLIAHLCSLPAPVPGGSAVAVTIGDTPLPPLSLPRIRDIPIIDVPLYPLFDILGVDSVVLLFKCALLEEKIIVVSSDITLLTVVCEGLAGLMYPFREPSAFIPVLPKEMAEILHCIGGPIIGAHVSTLANMKHAPQDGVVVDMDNRQVRIPGKLVSFPKAAESALMQDLRAILKFSGDSLEWSPRRDSRTTEEFDLSVRAAFLRFQASILRGYMEYVVFVRIFEVPSIQFDTDGFLGEISEDKDFWRRLATSTPFLLFVHEYSGLDGVSLFDDVLRANYENLSAAKRTAFLSRPKPPVYRAHIPVVLSDNSNDAGWGVIPPLDMERLAACKVELPAIHESPLEYAACRRRTVSEKPAPGGFEVLNRIVSSLQQEATGMPAIDPADVASLKESFKDHAPRFRWVTAIAQANLPPKISEFTAKVFADIHLVLLDACAKESDWRTASLCFCISDEFCTESSTIMSRVASAAILQSRSFWKHYFIVRKGGLVLPKLYGTREIAREKLHELSAEQKAQAATEEKALLYSYLLNTVEKMIGLRVEPDVVQYLIDQAVFAADLDAFHKKKLGELVQSIPNATTLNTLPSEVRDAAVVVLWVDKVNTQSNLTLERLKTLATKKNVYLQGATVADRAELPDFITSYELREWLTRNDISPLRGKLRVVTNRYRQGDGDADAALRVIQLRDTLGLDDIWVLVFCGSTEGTENMRAMPHVRVTTDAGVARDFCITPELKEVNVRVKSKKEK
eukprot:m51a1_g4794 putative myotubularin-related protein 13 (966) ;mRNA; f:76895-80980